MKPARLYFSEELTGKFLDRIKEELNATFEGCKDIAIKIHFGEPGNEAAFRPEMIEPVTDILKELGISFFFFDSPVWYPSLRNTPEGQMQVAIEKGWDHLGQVFSSGEHVLSKGKHMDYQVCLPLAEAEGVLVISHLKGHNCSGFGGAIKNLGMGALTKKSKGDIHEGGRPVYHGGCTGCLACERICPERKIKVTDRPVIKDGCYGCSLCSYACPAGALKPKTEYFDILLADGALAAQSKFRRFYYVTYLVNIVHNCDCEEDPGPVLAKDCGYLAGHDAVAIDRAAHDIITSGAGEDVFLKNNRKSGLQHVEAAEKLGMGTSEYELVDTA